MHILIEATHLPGRTCNPNPSGHVYANIHVGVTSASKRAQGMTVVPGRPWTVVGAVPGDAPEARWELTATARRDERGLDLTGPCIRGSRGDRSIGLAWGEVGDEGTFALFRGAKLRLGGVDPATLTAAAQPGMRLVARLGLTDAKGNPRCATVPASDITWSAEPHDGGA